MTCSEAFEPAITLATSPGMALRRKKVSTAVASKVSADQIRRLMNRFTMLLIDPNSIEAIHPKRFQQGAFEPALAQGILVDVTQHRARGVLHDQPLRLLVKFKPTPKIDLRRGLVQN